MAAAGNATVLKYPVSVSQEQISVPHEYLKEEEDQDVRKDKFLDDLKSKDLICGICFEFPHPRDFCISHCGQSACNPCLDEWFSRNNKCPLCSDPRQTRKSYVTDKRGKVLLEELRATCLYGCGNDNTIHGTIEHQKQCTFRLVTCPTCKEVHPMNKKEEHDLTSCKITCTDCHQKVIIRHMPDHKKESCMQTCNYCQNHYLTRIMLKHKAECDKRPFICICKLTIQFCDYHEHKSLCPKERVLCPNGCKDVYERENRQHHNSVCKKAIVKCKMCPFEDERGKMPEHEANKVLHWEQAIMEQQKLNKLLQDQNSVLTKQQKQNDELQKRYEEQQELNTFMQRRLTVIIEENELILKQQNEGFRAFGKILNQLERDMDAMKVEVSAVHLMSSDLSYLMQKDGGFHVPKPSQGAAVVNVSDKPSQPTAAVEQVSNKPSQPAVVEHVSDKPSQATAASSRSGLSFRQERFYFESNQPVVYQHNVSELRGSTVKRGPKWTYGSEDGFGTGTIMSIKYRNGMYFAEVEWKNGNTYEHYCIDGESHRLVFA